MARAARRHVADTVDAAWLPQLPGSNDNGAGQETRPFERLLYADSQLSSLLTRSLNIAIDARQ
jgi:hypothetical protein